MIGRTVSHYKILEEIGSGGMGVVYKAEDTKLKRMVALKFLPAELTRDEEAKTRFIREAQAASALQHHNICTIHETDETSDGHLFIAMDCYEGETLKQKIAGGVLSIEDAIHIISQTAEGLSEAHAAGVVHRDIKPANILVTGKGIVKILDFGIAKLGGKTKVTTMGSTVGTVAYMSPEQARGDDIDARSDIWSLGVVLYEMLTGVQPFTAEYDQAVIYRILNEEPAPVGKFRSDVSSGIVGIMNKVLAKDPQQRYQHVDEFASNVRSLAESIESRSVTESSTKKPSIAVLPFLDLSPEKDQEYFCDGMAEEVINSLAAIKGIRVAARTSAFSFKGEKHNVQEIGCQLRVETVLEGSIRKAGNRLRIAAQLVSVSDGYQLWSDKFDRNLEDIFDIQDEISLAIVDKLRVELLGEEQTQLVKRSTENIDAYNAYVKGRSFWEQRGEGLVKAIEYFNEALVHDPSYAKPYTGLADSYSLLAFYGYRRPKEVFPKAREYAQKALAIDPTVGEAYCALGYITLFHDWDIPAAQELLKKAIKLNPSYAPSRYWHATSQNLLGRDDEVIEEMERAIETDPLSLQIYTQFGWNLLGLHKFDRAIEQFKRALELNPNFVYARMLLGVAYCFQERYEEAIRTLRRAAELSNYDGWVLACLGYALGSVGQKVEAVKLLVELGERSKKQYIRPYYFVLIHLGLGNFEETFEWLEKLYQDRDVWMVVIHRDLFFDKVRSDPRYTALMEKVQSKN